MKKILMSFSALLCAVALHGYPTLSPKDGKAEFSVSNPNPSAVKDAPVVVLVDRPEYRSAVVTVGGKEVPSQIDFLENGPELSFVVDLKAKQKQKVKVSFSESAPDPAAYPYRVHAQMFLLDENKNKVPREVITATEDNMYNKLHHHGPAVESEYTAYRVYYDKKQTIDLYGKKLRRIELPETLWYPTDQQLVDRYGDDVLYVGGSVGLGAMKGWTGTQASHIEPMEKREAKILAKGPVRAIMEMNVEGWEYNGRKIDMESRYTIYAGHRDVEVRNRFRGEDAHTMLFATGILKMRKGDIRIKDDEGMIAVWGRDFPVNDTVKYPQQTIGMGIDIPESYVQKYAEDKVNYLYVVMPDADNEIHYRITFAAEMEDDGYKTSEQFFDYIARWREEKPVEVIIK